MFLFLSALLVSRSRTCNHLRLNTDFCRCVWNERGTEISLSFSTDPSPFFLSSFFFCPCCRFVCTMESLNRKEITVARILLRQWHFSSYSFSHFIACCRCASLQLLMHCDLRFEHGSYPSYLFYCHFLIVLLLLLLLLLLSRFSPHSFWLRLLFPSLVGDSLFLVFGTHLANVLLRR